MLGNSNRGMTEAEMFHPSLKISCQLMRSIYVQEERLTLSRQETNMLRNIMHPTVCIIDFALSLSLFFDQLKDDFRNLFVCC